MKQQSETSARSTRERHNSWKRVKITLAALASVVTTTATSTVAQAQSYVLADSFDGTAAGAPGSGYSFGYTSAGTFGGALTPFNASCDSTNIDCARATGIAEASASKATINGGEFDPSGSAFYNAGEINFHPGTSGENAGFQFLVPVSGIYNYALSLSSNDSTSNHSVDYRFFQGTNLLQSGILNTAPFSFSGTANTSAGNAFTLLIGANNDFRFDSTGVSASFALVDGGAAVPEPASWAMMLIGFGTVGGAIRTRRRRAALSMA